MAENIIPPLGYPSIGVPPFDVPNLGNDVRERIMERMRRAIRGQSPVPVKSIEEKRQEMEFAITSQGHVNLYEEVAIIYPGKEVDRKQSSGIHDIALLNLETLEQLWFQFVPKELSFDPKAEVVGIATMGRNLNVYHYTSGEDTLTFEIDWFSQEEGREDVLRRCKWVESLSRNNGYEEPIPRVKLLWGDTMLSESTWIVKAAPYRLSLPHRAFSYFMQQGYQQVTLARVSLENPKTSDIRNIAR